LKEKNSIYQTEHHEKIPKCEHLVNLATVKEGALRKAAVLKTEIISAKKELF